MEEVVVLEPLEHSVLDVSLDGGPMAGKLDLEPGVFGFVWKKIRPAHLWRVSLTLNR